MLEFPRLRELVAGYSGTDVGRAWTLALSPSADAHWIDREQQRVCEVLHLLQAGFSFDFHGLIDPAGLLETARISGAVLDVEQLRSLIGLVARIRSLQEWMQALPQEWRDRNPLLPRLAAPLAESSFGRLLQSLDGKFEADGSIADRASPELGRIRRQIERQQRSIQDSLRGMLRRLSAEGSLQEDVITVRGERFVIPVKAEWKRRVPGVFHGASSSGQTVFVEPIETIEPNNELQRLLEEEQAEIQRILAAMTRQIAEHAEAIQQAAGILAEMDSLFGRARFAQAYRCVHPVFHAHPPSGPASAGESSRQDSASGARIALSGARHPLLEQRLRAADSEAPIVPLDLDLPAATPQMIVSGPNTGGKTVALKTVGLLALMAQSGIPVPAEKAELPLFDAVLADIGDAQSIEQNLSTFSAHIVRMNFIFSMAGQRSLVLLDELGSATDPEEGAALAAAIAAHFVQCRAWCLISTHHTSLKVYAANTPGVVNAAAGFDEQTLAPTYRLRVGVPGASAGINIAQRLGLDARVIASARQRLGQQTEEIGRFLDRLHADLLNVSQEREQLRRREEELTRERQRLEREGRQEQQRKVREMEDKLASLLKSLEHQMREVLQGVEDRAAQQKGTRLAERSLAKLRREFREQMDATVVAHQTGADKNDPNAQPHLVRSVAVGDTVLLRSLGKNAVVQRQLDADTFEVTAGLLKMRIARGDIARVVSSAADRQAADNPVAAARSRGIRISLARDENATGATEINVIGRTVLEATDEVEKFLDQAFLAGLPQVRIVHGSGMGVLRKALRAYLARHPHVAAVSEPPQNEGGAGATLVQMRQ